MSFRAGQIAVGLADGVWLIDEDPEQGRLKLGSQIELPMHLAGSIKEKVKRGPDVQFSSNGKLLYAGVGDKVNILSLETRNLTGQKNIDNQFIPAFEITPTSNVRIGCSPDGRYFAASMVKGSNPLLQFFETKSNQMAFELRGHRSGYPPKICFSPDGSRVLTCTGREVKLWTLGKGVGQIIVENKSKIRSLSYSNDDSLIFSISDTELVVLNSETGETIVSLSGSFFADRFEIGKGLPLVVVSTQHNMLYAWDRETGEIFSVNLATKQTVDQFLIGRSVHDFWLSQDENILYACTPSELNIWELDLNSMKKTDSEVFKDLGRIKISPNRKWLVSANENLSDGTTDIELWQVSNGSFVELLATIPNGFNGSSSFDGEGSFSIYKVDSKHEHELVSAWDSNFQKRSEILPQGGFNISAGSESYRERDYSNFLASELLMSKPAVDLHGLGVLNQNQNTTLQILRDYGRTAQECSQVQNSSKTQTCLGYRDGRVRIIRCDKGSPQFQGLEMVDSQTFCSNNKYFACVTAHTPYEFGSPRESKLLVIYDLESGRKSVVVPASFKNGAYVGSIEFNKDSSAIVLGLKTGLAKNEHEFCVIEISSLEVSSFRAEPIWYHRYDNSFSLSSGLIGNCMLFKKGASTWGVHDSDSGKTWEIKSSEEICNAYFSEKNNNLALVCSNGNLEFWSLNEQKRIRLHERAARMESWKRDNFWLNDPSDESVAIPSPEGAHVFSLSTGESVARINFDVSIDRQLTTVVEPFCTFSKNGNYIFQATGDPLKFPIRYQLWDVHKGAKVLQDYKNPKSGYGPQIWDMHDSSLRFCNTPDAPSKVLPYATSILGFSQDGTRLAAVVEREGAAWVEVYHSETLEVLLSSRRFDSDEAPHLGYLSDLGSILDSTGEFLATPWNSSLTYLRVRSLEEVKFEKLPKRIQLEFKGDSFCRFALLDRTWSESNRVQQLRTQSPNQRWEYFNDDPSRQMASFLFDHEYFKYSIAERVEDTRVHWHNWQALSQKMDFSHTFWSKVKSRELFFADWELALFHLAWAKKVAPENASCHDKLKLLFDQLVKERVIDEAGLHPVVVEALKMPRGKIVPRYSTSDVSEMNSDIWPKVERFSGEDQDTVLTEFEITRMREAFFQRPHVSHLNTMALAEYRLGNFDLAITAATASNRLYQSDTQTLYAASYQINQAILAMSHHRLGKHEEASRFRERFEETFRVAEESGRVDGDTLRIRYELNQLFASPKKSSPKK